MPQSQSRSLFALALLGAVVGGAVGYFAFFWIVRQGFYAIMLPPALVGLGAGLVTRTRSQLLAILCAIGGLGLGIFTEWKYGPFLVDDSLSYFLTHVHTLRPIKLVMLAVGTVASYRFALGRDQTKNVDSGR